MKAVEVWQQKNLFSGLDLKTFAASFCLRHTFSPKTRDNQHLLPQGWKHPIVLDETPRSNLGAPHSHNSLNTMYNFRSPFQSYRALGSLILKSHLCPFPRESYLVQRSSHAWSRGPRAGSSKQGVRIRKTEGSAVSSPPLWAHQRYCGMVYLPAAGSQPSSLSPASAAQRSASSDPLFLPFWILGTMYSRL